MRLKAKSQMCHNNNVKLQKILQVINKNRILKNTKLIDQVHTQIIITTTTTNHTKNETKTRNCLIRSYTKTPTTNKAILVFNHYYTKTTSFVPDNYTYPCLLNACSSLYLTQLGKQIHAHVMKTGVGSDVFVGNSLVYFYGFVGLVNAACSMFDEMPVRDVVSWNSLMAVCNSLVEVMGLFKDFIFEGFRGDKVTLVTVLSACARAQGEGIEFGRMVHARVVESGFGTVVEVCNAILDMYVKCEDLGSALMVFDEMGCVRDVVSYTVMISGYVAAGLMDLARDVFDCVAEKDVVLWNLILHGYVKGKHCNEALELYSKMREVGVIPDENTMVSVLSACAASSNLQCGRLAHQYMLKYSVTQNVFVKTALIGMYSKCGALGDALTIFDRMESRDVHAWSTMIDGLANSGYAREALSLFYQMEENGIPPNGTTFVSVLTACSHSGFVEEGLELFKSMVRAYKVQPQIIHFCCLIDLFSRAGLLYQAKEFVESLVLEERMVAYKSLLSACIKYSELDIGDEIAKRMLKLSGECRETKILLSNYYAVAGEWAGVERSRRFTKGSDTTKSPGISFLLLNS